MNLTHSELTHRYQRILEAMSEGVYGLNAEGHATFVNSAAEQLTGWTQDEIRGKSIHQFHHHSHADGSHYPQCECPIYHTLQTGKSAHSDREVFWRKDGSFFAVEYSSSAIIENGEITYPVNELTIAGNLEEMFKREGAIWGTHTFCKSRSHTAPNGQATN